MLLGRLPERAALSGLLDAARAGRSGVLVVRGEPGAGKTALLEWATESAAGVRVARVTGETLYIATLSPDGKTLGYLARGLSGTYLYLKTVP